LAWAQWTPHGLIRDWQRVASSGDGAKQVAVDTNGGQIYTSTDSGTTWTARETLIEKAGDLTPSIEGVTDQFEDEVSALTDAASAAEKAMKSAGSAA
jgi:hypothetical protein